MSERDEMDENDDDQNHEQDDDELPTLADMFGFENDEDNEEAALDYVLKIQENE